jgi:hypothetical protein
VALTGLWLSTVGLLFAVAPDTTSRFADRLRHLPDPQPPSPRQKLYGRTAGIALACLGTLLIVVR